MKYTKDFPPRRGDRVLYKYHSAGAYSKGRIYLVLDDSKVIINVGSILTCEILIEHCCFISEYRFPWIDSIINYFFNGR